MISPKQEMLICDFIKTAKLNGASFILAALPAKHSMMVSGNGVQMKQIRTIKDQLAAYGDGIGNTVALMTTGFVKQF